jgi:rhodanese-related sulfurtransferase
MFRPPEVERITAAEFKTRLERGDAIAVLDVREPVERDYCAIRLPATARDMFIPMGELPARLEEVKAVTGAALVVVYCHLGVRSRQAAGWLAQHGLAGLANLEGGIDAWSADVDPDVPRY